MKPLPNFDAQFAKYLERWVRANSSKFKNPDQMEAKVPDVYLRWLNAPAAWLNGHTPGTAFAAYTDAEELTALLAEYSAAGVPIPDPLMERIVELGEEAAGALARIALTPESSAELRVTALNLLKECSPLPQALDEGLAELMLSGAEADVKDVTAELLTAQGGRVVKPLLARLPLAGEQDAERLLDVLCNFPGDESIYNYAVKCFLGRPERRALIASYLGKLGDQRAIAHLEKALYFTELNYLDYIEIRGAIESLGGEVTIQRDFSGDPYFESMRTMRG